MRVASTLMRNMTHHTLHDGDFLPGTTQTYSLEAFSPALHALLPALRLSFNAGHGQRAAAKRRKHATHSAATMSVPPDNTLIVPSKVIFRGD